MKGSPTNSINKEKQYMNLNFNKNLLLRKTGQQPQ
jgi:hypothetical protein